MAQGRVCMAADVSAVAMTPDLGAEIRGIDLSSPLSDGCFRRILDLFHRYCVVFLRDQALDPRLLARFAARFGEIDLPAGGEASIPGLPQVSVIVDSLRDPPASGRARYRLSWHSDHSSQPAPALATVLYAADCPDRGGDIEFVNMCSVFNALPREKQLFLEKLRALHGADLAPAEAALGAGTAADATPPLVEHPVVRVHRETGRKALYVAKDTVSRVLGLAAGASRKLIDELEAFATQPRFIYAHHWRKGDVLVWDNRCTLHRMRPFDQRYERTLHCIQIKGEVPIAA
ncbi:MAG: TauD/TfdA family dioxygenase [Burkholderiales bacterium]|nr:TauD/TfdA family dioxygenase [Burkholderiales bacterium]